jgi:hypothetical protein
VHCKISESMKLKIFIYLRDQHCNEVNLTVLRYLEEIETDPELNLKPVIEG